MNVDLLFVPAEHAVDHKLPAVSGSSGHLVIERLTEEAGETSYAGKVFANAELSYEEAMQQFVEASAPISGKRKSITHGETPSKREQTRQLRQERAELRAQRRQIRQTRQAEDAAWRKRRSELSEKPKVRAHWGTGKRKAEQRRALREQRQQQRATRQQEDAQWRAASLLLRQKMAQLPIVSAWIAVLLITDNCTRQCLGLPIFVVGAHVTAEMIVTALRSLLPDNLHFLISDRGVHFTAQAFQQFAQEVNFVHVLVARHRPQSDGIAERLVRTVKEWLADKSWSSNSELSALLAFFLTEYNNRPHQGLPLPGLSPNEFAKRIWLM